MPESSTSHPADPADVQSIDAIIAAAYNVISGPAGQKRDWSSDVCSSDLGCEAELSGIGILSKEFKHPHRGIMSGNPTNSATSQGA